MKFLKEFKEFAAKGNVLDLAIGVVIGTSFGKIVTSLVNDLFTPLLGFFIGKVKFSNLKIVLLLPELDSSGKVVAEAITLNYGSFMQTVFDFLIVSLALFLFVKAINRLKRKSEEVNSKEVPPPKEIELLTEIRDLLKNRPS